MFTLIEAIRWGYPYEVPNGYCDLAGTGVSCSIGLKVPATAAS